jgi:hypothetical protein
VSAGDAAPRASGITHRRPRPIAVNLIERM